MKVKITVINKANQHQKFILFGSRYNLMMVNYGNNATIELQNIEVDDEYKEKIGEMFFENNNNNWGRFHVFMLDLFKFDLRVISINGKAPTKKLEDGSEVEYNLNPYSEVYETLIHFGINEFEVEIKFADDVKCGSTKNNILLLRK